MEVRHIIWKKVEYDEKGNYKGLLRVKYGFHGDDYHYTEFVYGRYDAAKEKITVFDKDFYIEYASWLRVTHVGEMENFDPED